MNIAAALPWRIEVQAEASGKESAAPAKMAEVVNPRCSLAKSAAQRGTSNEAEAVNLGHRCSSHEPQRHRRRREKPGFREAAATAGSEGQTGPCQAPAEAAANVHGRARLHGRASPSKAMQAVSKAITGGTMNRLLPNPSFERTHTGMPLQAFISFWALRVLPVRAAQLKRWAA